MIAEQTKNKWGREVHRGKWGYYPCSYEYYEKLKAINKLYLDALHKQAAWERWDRKAPHNRVIRKKIRNSEGDVVGYQASEPMAEPELSHILHKVKKSSSWAKGGKYFGNNNPQDLLYAEFVRDEFHLIPEVYRQARYPVDNPGDVKPLKLDLKLIDSFYDLV